MNTVSLRCSACGCHLRFCNPKDIGNLKDHYLCESCNETLLERAAYVKDVARQSAKQINRIRDFYTEYLDYFKKNGLVLKRGDIRKDKEELGMKILKGVRDSVNS